MFGKLWNLVSIGLTIYSVNKHLKTAAVAKDDIYAQLSPELQEQWNKVFGKPEAPQFPVTPEVKVSQVEQIKASI